MKGIVVGLTLGCLTLCLAGLGYQASSQSRASRQDYISLGSNLELGTSESDVRNALAKNYDLVREASAAGHWLVAEKDKPAEVLGVVAFKNGRLDFVTKRWLTRTEDQKGSAQGAKAVYAVLSEFIRQGERSCVIKTEEQQTPNLSTKISTIACGPKHLELLVNSIPGEADTVDINESLQ